MYKMLDMLYYMYVRKMLVVSFMCLIGLVKLKSLNICVMVFIYVYNVNKYICMYVEIIKYLRYLFSL